MDDSLRDRLVCGLKSESIKRRLLTEDGLTFDKAYTITIGMELAANQLKVMGSENVQINKVSQKPLRKWNKPTLPQVKSNTQSSQVKSNFGPNQFGKKQKCMRCTRMHFNNNKCPAVEWKCFSCGLVGHTAKSAMCRSRVHDLEEEQEDKQSVESDDNLELGLITEGVGECVLKTLKTGCSNILKIQMLVDNKYVDMEVDTGAVRSVIHVNDYNKLFSNHKLEPVKFNLKVITGQTAKIVGKIYVNVSYKEKLHILPLIVLHSELNFIPLIGRNWLDVLNCDWRSKVMNEGVVAQANQSIDVISEVMSNNVRLKFISQVKKEFHSLFLDESNSFIKDFKAEFNIKEGFKPIFHRAYEVPYALKAKVEEELSNLVTSGILSKVTHSNWASPIVIVPKKNSKDIRLCVDFKKTLNKAIDGEHCVLPLPNDIFASLSGSKYFTVLDLKGAYQQLQISDSSKELFTINTHIGLFRFNRLTYGVSSAPGIFQCIMDAILSGLPKVKCYLDDILIHGTTIEECNQNLQNVLNRLKKFNVKINEKKCKFFEDSVEFLGHKIDASGTHPTNLCKKETEFIWTKECDRAFQNSKQLMTSENVLVHYDPNKPIFITCDSSGYGVGAVLSHKIDGEDRPVLFASSTLSNTEKKYSNLEREGLALIFGLNKFHKYVHGRKFTLVTDHQPLQFIFSQNKNIPVTAAARITRWAVTLSAYDYNIQYRKGSLISNADGLSRLPMKNKTLISDALFSFSLHNDIPINSHVVASATKKDITLSKVLDLTLSGWPNIIQDNLKPYFKRKLELSVEDGCVLIGNKVIIPEVLQKEILNLFHEQHLGIVRTKMLMRSYCWWPGINEDIEKYIAACTVCQETQNFSNRSVLLPWPSAPNNFYRVNRLFSKIQLHFFNFDR